MKIEEAIPYLLERGLLATAHLVGADVVVEDHSRRNRNLRVTCGNGPSYFIKEADRSNDLTNGAMGAEARQYQALRTLARPIAPEMRLYDEARQLLVLDLVPSSTTLNHILDIDRLRSHARPLAALARIMALFQETPTSAPERPGGVQIPWALRFMNPAPDLLRTVSQGQLEVIRRIQGDTDASSQLARSREHYSGTSLVHGDLRFDNVLVRAGRQGNVRRIWIVDWELATVGDEAWDIGTVFAGLLARCLRHMELPGEVNSETLREAFARWLPRTKPEIRAFWAAFARAKRIGPSRSEWVLANATCYCGAKLLQSAFEWSPADAISPMAACQLQLGLNILRRPREAAAQVLGLVSSAS